MLDLEDPWWIVAVAILIGLWVLEVAIPVAIARPVFAVGEQYTEYDSEDVADVPVHRPLGPLWPVTGAVLAGLFLGLTVWRYVISSGERKWMWMSVTAFVTFTWALTLILIAARAAHHLASPGGG